MLKNIAYFKWVNYLVCKLYLNKTCFKKLRIKHINCGMAWKEKKSRERDGYSGKWFSHSSGEKPKRALVLLIEYQV